MGTHPIFESDFDCLTVLVCMSTSIDVSGEIDAPLIPEKKESFMASWSNIALTGNVRDVLNAQREKIRPWSEFAEQKEFFAPAGLQEWTKRAIKNVSHYQSNYIIVFLVLMTYCVLTSPLLLIALAVSGIGSYTVSKHEGQSPDRRKGCSQQIQIRACRCCFCSSFIHRRCWSCSLLDSGSHGYNYWWSCVLPKAPETP